MEPDAYSEPSRTSKMKLFPKILNGLKQLIIFAKSSILDIRLGSKYTPGNHTGNQKKAKFLEVTYKLLKDFNNIRKKAYSVQPLT